MCTAVIDVTTAGTVRLLAVRDEDPARAWDAPGEWWPEHPGVVGVRDRRAGGAWLAVNPAERRLAVLLNRADSIGLPEDLLLSRGSLALDAVEGKPPAGSPRMHGFNLLDVNPDGARVLSWDGIELRTTTVPPGVHMIAHDDLDDAATPRIATWLPEFRSLRSHRDGTSAWIAVLERSSTLAPEDDRALIRDNRPYGYSTQSLLYCTATVTAGGVDLGYRALPRPARLH